MGMLEEYQQLSLENYDLIQDRAHDIYYTYVALGSPCQVNISGENTYAVGEAVRNIRSDVTCLHIFDNAQKEIYKVMSEDSFPRFEKTQRFIELKSQIETGKVSQHDRGTAGKDRNTAKQDQGSLAHSLVERLDEGSINFDALQEQLVQPLDTSRQREDALELSHRPVSVMTDTPDRSGEDFSSSTPERSVPSSSSKVSPSLDSPIVGDLCPRTITLLPTSSDIDLTTLREEDERTPKETPRSLHDILEKDPLVKDDDPSPTSRLSDIESPRRVRDSVDRVRDSVDGHFFVI